jgi:carbon-monoxide dehydrogenase small subunit
MISFRLNGKQVSVDAPEEADLLYVLLNDLNMNGSKLGCGRSQCGACTVLIDGEPKLSCLIPAERAEGASIETLEGLAKNGAPLHPVQAAFAENFAAQCGFCTSGMILAAKALLDRNPEPDRAAVVDAISGNICRCTGYEPIIGAILVAAAAMRGRQPA